MDDDELALAQRIYNAVQRASHDSVRSGQSKAFVIGVSDLGFCSERTRRKLAGIEEPGEGDKLEAFLGTAIGDAVEQAYLASHPEITVQAEVTVRLEGDGGTYEIIGHPDIVEPDKVGDVKSVDGLTVVKRNGPTQQQLFQRHLGCKAAHEAGLLKVPLEEARTYNVWIDRSGRTKEVYVHIDTFNPEVVEQATMWLDEVVYNYRHNQAAMKEPPRTFCEKVCGHFTDCRQFDSDVEGLITDPEIATAVLMKKESSALTAKADRLKKEANAILEGVNGYVRTVDGNFQLRTTWVNGTHVDYDRNGYWRINISKVKG